MTAAQSIAIATGIGLSWLTFAFGLGILIGKAIRGPIDLDEGLGG
ncbi:hypothetical protein [Novosphingobium pentaromativorans]|uniref:Uncharacterized protein n=1 Tax=Novosphingobium pentaromativorans US6-1 TaxID=1088721 RepID=G6E7H0_9SPHN|nr:hypothetical protein [Novosphingobium pentaromativorans]EHJ62793.1 hypothetical protein NSU_0305 [Novosphingobium pentaromativorans US6-1]